MEHVLSTHLFVRHRLTTVWLERIWSAGFSSVELFCARQHVDYRDRAQITELGHWFRDSTLTMHSLHAPMFSDDVWGRSGPQAIVDLTEPQKGKRLAAVDETKRAIEVAEEVPFRYVILHLGTPGQEMDEKRWDSGFSSLEELKVFAGQRGVEVLLENIPNALSHAERLNDFLAATHLNLGYCFDVGHANLGRGVAAEFNLMKERIKSTHIHDNDGVSDQHLFPGHGTVNWIRTMELLHSRGDQFPLLLELNDVASMEHPVDEARRAIAKLEELSIEYER
jgi:sugar phosphate isomerase/epimerase